MFGSKKNSGFFKESGSFKKDFGSNLWSATNGIYLGPLHTPTGGGWIPHKRKGSFTKPYFFAF